MKPAGERAAEVHRRQRRRDDCAIDDQRAATPEARWVVFILTASAPCPPLVATPMPSMMPIPCREGLFADVSDFTPSVKAPALDRAVLVPSQLTARGHLTVFLQISAARWRMRRKPRVEPPRRDRSCRPCCAYKSVTLLLVMVALPAVLVSKTACRCW